MQVHEALEQLDVIHDHVARAEVYRGFAAPGVALVGVAGLLAAILQPSFTEPESLVIYWLTVAGLGGAIGFGAAIHAYVYHEDEIARRKTRRVLAQFVPCLASGAMITAAFAGGGMDFIVFLPGFWAIAFGLGIIAARPYLPRGIGYVGLAYLLAGGVLLSRRFATHELFAGSVGGVFGVGHLLTAAVLHFDRPRNSHE